MTSKLSCPAFPYLLSKTPWTWKNGSCHHPAVYGKRQPCLYSATICDTGCCRFIKGFIGNVWKLAVTISCASADQDFQPSVSVKNLRVDYIQATVPQAVSTGAKRFCTPSQTYRVLHNNATIGINPYAHVEQIDPTQGIWKELDWIGPTVFETSSWPIVNTQKYLLLVFCLTNSWFFLVFICPVLLYRTIIAVLT